MTIDIEKLADEFLHGADRNGAYYGYADDLKQFAEAYAAKVLEDKEREIAELKTTVRSDNSKVIAALNAHINDLREALEDTNTRLNEMVDVFYKGSTAADRKRIADNFELLSKTPAQSLQEHDNEVIEKCAKVCDEAGQPNKDEIHTDAQWAAKVLAANIRALKVTNE